MIDAREIYDEAARRMAGENLSGAAEYSDMADEVIADFIDNGRMLQEDDDESLREDLEMLWSQRERQEGEE